MTQDSSLAKHRTLGIDIGGANLKYATCDGRSKSVAFPLWLRPDDLAEQLQRDIATFADIHAIVATMTGELADCFLDRAEGVRHIIGQLTRAASRGGHAAPLIYCMDVGFVDSSEAVNRVDDASASNWHALACFVGKEFQTRSDEEMLLVDIGSTTTDVIPIRGGRIATDRRSDFGRLAESSLVYLGGGRTPICSFARTICWDDRSIPVMREVFATIEDARVLLGHHPADASDCRTADGKPRDEFHCANRLARMIGLDHRSVSVRDATSIAQQLHQQARVFVEEAIARVKQRYGLGTDATTLVSGHCNDLLPDGIRSQKFVSLAEKLGGDLSRVAPAYAIARLHGNHARDHQNG